MMLLFQELVNLMMFGRAYSNVFDGTKRLGSAKDGWMVLQGAPRRPSIGFLSLFEAYACIEATKTDEIGAFFQVGSRYKGPTCPIWVICAESHYTVLFSADPAVNPQDSDKVRFFLLSSKEDFSKVYYYNLLYHVDSLSYEFNRYIGQNEEVLDLFYFDQLARQSERIRLTVMPKKLPAHLMTGFEEGESMIDRCIRTKWKARCDFGKRDEKCRKPWSTGTGAK